MNNCLQAPQKVKNVLNRLKHGKIRLRFSKRIHVKDFHATADFCHGRCVL